MTQRQTLELWWNRITTIYKDHIDRDGLSLIGDWYTRYYEEQHQEEEIYLTQDEWRSLRFEYCVHEMGHAFIGLNCIESVTIYDSETKINNCGGKVTPCGIVILKEYCSLLLAGGVAQCIFKKKPFRLSSNMCPDIFENMSVDLKMDMMMFIGTNHNPTLSKYIQDAEGRSKEIVRNLRSNWKLLIHLSKQLDKYGHLTKEEIGKLIYEYRKT